VYQIIFLNETYKEHFFKCEPQNIYIYIYISNQLEQDFLSPEETTAAVHDPSQSEKGLAHLKKKKKKKKKKKMKI
jgi:hypothetical protein